MTDTPASRMMGGVANSKRGAIEMAEYTLYIFHETAKAFNVGKTLEAREDESSFWLPKSVVGDPDQVTNGGNTFATFEIPDWLANEKGLDNSLDGDLIE